MIRDQAKFQGLSQKSATRQSFQKLLADKQTPRRVCFATTHAQALKRASSSGHVGSLNLPFSDSVGPIFSAMTGMRLWPNKRAGLEAVWLSLKTEEDFETAAAWIDRFRDLVFLRDLLSASIALGLHQLPASGGAGFERTHIGELERRAKYEGCEASKQALRDLIVETVGLLPFYQCAHAVCAVPRTPEGPHRLQETLCAEAAEMLGVEDLSSYLGWGAPKSSLKETAVSGKWDALEAAGLHVDGRLEGETVILIDDLYQSGTTMNFVAGKLREAGAGHVLGLALSKSMRDSDNL